MDDSILISIKKLLGMDSEYNYFDTDIIIHINTVLSILCEMGVGPSEGFLINDDSERWSDFIGNDLTLVNIKTFVYLKVKLLFDPPSNGATSSYEELINELTWRIYSKTNYKEG